MNEGILRGGFFHRFFLWLASCYRASLLVGFFRFWGRQLNTSHTKALLCKVLGSPMRATDRSLVSHLTGRLLLSLRRMFAAIQPEKSLIARALSRASASNVYKRSLFGGIALRLERGSFLLGVFCLYLPIEWLIRLTTPEQIGAIWDQLFLVLCILAILISRLNPRNQCVSGATPLDGALLLFLGIGVLLVCVVSPIFPVAVSGWRAVYEYMLWFFVVARLARTWRATKLCCNLFVLMGAALGLHAIYQFIVAAPIPTGWVSIYESSLRTRAYSIVGSPNILGCLFVMLAPMAAGMAYAAKKTRQKLLYWGFVAVMCLGCLFTFSRGAWVGMAVAVVLFSLLRDRRLLLVGGLAALIAMMTPQIGGRLSFVFTDAFERGNTTSGRGARWAYGLDLLHRNNPVFGFGLGRFGGAIAMQNQTERGLRYFYLDNYYMKVLVEMGYVGLVGYLFVLLSMLTNGLRALFRVRRQGERYSMLCGIFAGLSGVLAHCYFENIFEVPYMNAYFWGLCALMMVIGWKLRDTTAGSVGAQVAASAPTS